MRRPRGLVRRPPRPVLGRRRRHRPRQPRPAMPPMPPRRPPPPRRAHPNPKRRMALHTAQPSRADPPTLQQPRVHVRRGDAHTPRECGAREHTALSTRESRPETSRRARPTRVKAPSPERTARTAEIPPSRPRNRSPQSLPSGKQACASSRAMHHHTRLPVVSGRSGATLGTCARPSEPVRDASDTSGGRIRGRSVISARVRPGRAPSCCACSPPPRRGSSTASRREPLRAPPRRARPACSRAMRRARPRR